MDAAVQALTDPPERRAAARSEPRPGEATAQRADPVGRMEAELRRLCDGLLQRLESDRARVVSVLSDDVVSVITMARYLIEDAAQRLTRGELEDASEALQNASARIRDATDELVSLCSELKPRVLDDLGLLAALSWYLREFNRENRAIFVSPRITVAENDVPAELKLTAFRIVQAALSNVERHARASAARVYLSLVEDELRLCVEDNGVGFDVERWRHRRVGQEGCGLAVILRSVEGSGGHCSIESIPRHGARLLVTWPVKAVAQTGPPERVEPDVAAAGV
jgi:two-component system NarL family sensor kinase